MSLGRKLQICKFENFLKLQIFNPISKLTYFTDSFRRFAVLAKAMQCWKTAGSLSDHLA